MKNGVTIRPAKRVSILALLSAAAIIFSFAESLIPTAIVPIPGFKIGFANIIILLCIYRLNFADALIVNIVRVTVVAVCFGGVSAALYSIAGGTLAVIVMWLIKRTNLFSIYGIGVAGAMAHNLGQLGVAAILLRTTALVGYLPYLMICSLVCGVLIAVIAALIMKILNNKLKT